MLSIDETFDFNRGEAIGYFRGFPEFEGLRDEELGSIIAHGYMKMVPEGDEVCHQGEAGEEMFLVLEGEIQILLAGAKGPELLTVIGPGALFGEMSLLDGAPRSATALASTECRLLCFSRNSVDALATEDMEMGCRFLIAVIKATSAKLRVTLDRLVLSLETLKRLGG